MGSHSAATAGRSVPPAIARWVLLVWILGIVVVGIGSVLPGKGPPVPWSSPMLTHFVAYCGLAVLPVLIWPRWPGFLLVVFVLTAYGAMIELIQHFLSHRHGSWTDGFINLAGALSGALVAMGLAWLARLRAPKGVLH